MTDEETKPKEHGDATRAATAGMHSAERDHALVRLDEKEVQARMLDAFEAFLRTGFEVHLVGVVTRGATMFKLVLNEDGADDLPLRDVQEIADEHRLDVFVERGTGLVLYARW